MRRKILAVDDVLINIQCIQGLLGDTSDVLGAINADQAIRVLNKNAVDIVLMDVVMPGTDGPALVSRMRGANINVPVIFLSSETTSTPDGYRCLAKSTDKGVLLQQIEEVIRLSKTDS